MSIATEIERLNASKFAIAQAIRAKGVEVPENVKIDTLADYVTMIGSTSGIPVTFSGNPVVATNTIVDQPFAGLKIYGKTSQDTSSGLVSAGESKYITAVVNGAQLFDAKKYSGTTMHNGTELTVSDGVISYTATGSDSYVGGYNAAGQAVDSNSKKVLMPVVPNTFYRVSVDGDFSKNLVTEVGADFVATKTQVLFSSDIYFQTQPNTHYLLFRLGTSSYSENAKYSGKVMLSVGSDKISWEPYRVKEFAISTIDALPGVPVSSGGNCTDSTGQAFISNYLDFATGLQYILCGQIDSYNGEEITTPYISSTGALTTGAQVVYVLPEPQTQTIPAETLAIYRSLASYDGITVISIGEPVAYMEVRIYCDMEKTIDRKVSEGIAAAVKLSGGNT